MKQVSHLDKIIAKYDELLYMQVVECMRLFEGFYSFMECSQEELEAISTHIRGLADTLKTVLVLAGEKERSGKDA